MIMTYFDFDQLYIVRQPGDHITPVIGIYSSLQVKEMKVTEGTEGDCHSRLDWGCWEEFGSEELGYMVVRTILVTDAPGDFNRMYTIDIND